MYLKHTMFLGYTGCPRRLSSIFRDLIPEMMPSQIRHIALELKPVVLTLKSWDIVYSVAAVLYLQFVLHVMLCRMLNNFCTFTLVLSVACLQVPNMVGFVYYYYYC